jgi:hypothetical protein
MAGEQHGKGKVKFRGGAFNSTTAYGLLYSWPLIEFLHSSLEALHTSGVQRPKLAKEGTIDIGTINMEAKDIHKEMLQFVTELEKIVHYTWAIQ